MSYNILNKKVNFQGSEQGTIEDVVDTHQDQTISGLKTITYLKDKDFKSASVEMLDSKWAKQTPNRAKEMSEIVGGVS